MFFYTFIVLVVHTIDDKISLSVVISMGKANNGVKFGNFKYIYL